ncbi:unnamed protein product [Clavelina lepadiformis]|uniref:SAM-dependent MTase RsmB/NOP-type domain-containing protein n=1 Tax=Clavelina lepadiformis TaxID=159417 RepID=A0ABP0G138_CLALP
MPDLSIIRRTRSPQNPSSDALLGQESGSEAQLFEDSKNSLTVPGRSQEKVFWLTKSTNHRSEVSLDKTPFGKMPEWMTMQGIEHQRRARSIPDFLAGGHYGYPHEVYEAAAQIFERLAVRKNSGECLVQYAPVPANILPLHFESQRVKRQAYELAYEALKYQELLEDILSDSGYFFAHPASDDTTALIVVMLFDFQNRRWMPRCQIVGEKKNKEVADVEEHLMDHRIRLAAALARCRVKNQSLSIDYILPESVREQEKCASALPQYTWINTVKSKLDAVIQELEKNHYVEFSDPRILMPPRGKCFRLDQHCDDVILFPSDQKEALKCLEIVENGGLVLQDKTSSLAVRSVGALLTEDDECDLIHADVSSGLTTAHLAVLLHNVTKKRFEARELMYGNPRGFYLPGVSSTPQLNWSDEGALRRPTVFAFGVRSDTHREQLQKTMKNLGLKNVKLLSEKFNSIDSKDPRFENVKAVLVTPQCTRTAVANPIEFMLNEGDTESYDVLRDLSHGERHNKANEAGREHTEIVKTALKFSSAQAVVYTTRSIHAQENENVVNSAIKWHRDNGQGNHPFRVCPPILPLTSNDIRESEMEVMSMGRMTSSKSRVNPLKHNFLRMRQSTEMNGCFIAVMSREFDPNDTLSAKDVLRRAALQGLIAPASPLAETKPLSPSKEVTERKEEQGVEKTKRSKSKIAFGKKAKGSSSSHLPKHRKSATKNVDAEDVDRLLETYNNTHRKKKSSSKLTLNNVAQKNINLGFSVAETIDFSENVLSSVGKHDISQPSGGSMQDQVNTDMEKILNKMSSRDDTRM